MGFVFIVLVFAFSNATAIAQLSNDESAELSKAILKLAKAPVPERGTFETKDEYRARLPVWDSTRIWVLQLECKTTYSIDDSTLMIRITGIEDDGLFRSYYKGKNDLVFCEPSKINVGVQDYPGKSYTATTTKGKKIKVSVVNYDWSVVRGLEVCDAKHIMEIHGDYGTPIEYDGPKHDYDEEFSEEAEVVDVKLRVRPETAKATWNSIGAYVRCSVKGYETLQIDEETIGATVKYPKDMNIKRFILAGSLVDLVMYDKKSNSKIATVTFPQLSTKPRY